MRKFCISMLFVSILCVGWGRAAEISIPYYQKIVAKGYNETSVQDLSESKTLEFDEPSCAYINITNISGMPTSKTANMHAWFECYDGNNHYFKKKVILNAQGQSSLAYDKKNFAVDFCEDEWIGDKTTDITIGNWVAQDGFHFKAYYTDYFRGIGTICYKIFDDIVADHSSYQERMGLTDYDPKARCYPDGFPCVVYLNGDFYGIFGWQLKKHRKNTSQSKDNPHHIHIDGQLNDNTFWKETADWSQFEIRNPKTLLSTTTQAISGYKYVEITDNAEEIASMGDSWVDAPSNPKDMSSEELSASSPLYYKYTTSKGKIKYYKLTELSGYEYVEYDGDNPTEIIDENSEYYDANNASHVLTATVKKDILKLRGYWNELSALKNNGADEETMRSAIAERFDVTGLIDYIVFSLVTSNYDGFQKNWQWLTYDGVKWFVTPYDLDGTFGHIWTGQFVFPAYWTWSNQDYTMPFSTLSGPIYWMKLYYWPEIQNRYKELRENGIFTPEHIMQYVYDWYSRVGEEAYTSEKQKWPDSNCYRELICNPNWEASDDWTGFSAIAAYDANTTYYEGDKCTLDDRIWIATGTTTGVKPYAQSGYTDYTSRIEKWTADRLVLEDSYLKYYAPLQESYDLVVSSVGKATLCVPFTFDVPEGIQLYTVTGVDDNNNLTKEPVTTPVANKPYLVYGTPGTYTLSGTYEVGDLTAKDYMSNGLLWGTYSTVYVPEGGYVLQANDKEDASFALVTRSNYITLGANKAYLELPALGYAKPMFLDNGDDTPTSIEQVSSSDSYKGIDEIRNLSGIRLMNLQYGVNIVKYKNGTTKTVICK